MAAVFKRTENEDDGIEMPLKEAVSKSMICLMFDLGEDEFIFVLNEDGTVENTMLGSEAVFIPTKPGLYIVKTGGEVGIATGVAETDFQDNWSAITRINNRVRL